MTIRSTKQKSLFVATSDPQSPNQLNEDIQYAYIPATTASITEDRGTPIIERTDVMISQAGYLPAIAGPVASSVSFTSEIHISNLYDTYTDPTLGTVGTPQGGYLLALFQGTGHKIVANGASTSVTVSPEACTIGNCVPIDADLFDGSTSQTLTPCTVQFHMEAGCDETSFYTAWDAVGTWTLNAAENERVTLDWEFAGKRFNITDFTGSIPAFEADEALKLQGLSEGAFSSIVTKSTGSVMESLKVNGGNSFNADPARAHGNDVGFNSPLVTKNMSVEFHPYNPGNQNVAESPEARNGVEITFTSDKVFRADGLNLDLVDANGKAYIQGVDYEVNAASGTIDTEVDAVSSLNEFDVGDSTGIVEGAIIYIGGVRALVGSVAGDTITLDQDLAVLPVAGQIVDNGEQNGIDDAEWANSVTFYTAPPTPATVDAAIYFNVYDQEFNAFDLENISSVSFAPGRSLEDVTDLNAVDSFGISSIVEDSYAQLTFQAKDVGEVERLVQAGMASAALFSAKITIKDNENNELSILIPTAQISAAALTEAGNTWALDLTWNAVKRTPDTSSNPVWKVVMTQG